MTTSHYIPLITELLHQCSDQDLLDLIYKLLLNETGNQSAEVV